MGGTGVGAFSNKGSSCSFSRGIKVYNLDADDALVGSLGGAFINATGPSGDVVNCGLSPRRGYCFFGCIN